MEDGGGYPEFPALSASGDYRWIDQREAQTRVEELLEGRTSELVRLPSKPVVCYSAFDLPELSALIGADSVGRFAVIMCRWNLVKDPTWAGLLSQIHLTTRSTRLGPTDLAG